MRTIEDDGKHHHALSLTIHGGNGGVGIRHIGKWARFPLYIRDFPIDCKKTQELSDALRKRHYTWEGSGRFTHENESWKSDFEKWEDFRVDPDTIAILKQVL